jgi:DNA-binding NarL/FixJ family response regulator
LSADEFRCPAKKTMIAAAGLSDAEPEERSSASEPLISITPDVSDLLAELQRLRFEILKNSIAITRTAAALYHAPENDPAVQSSCMLTTRKGYQTMLSMLAAIRTGGAVSANLRPELDELKQALREIGVLLQASFRRGTLAERPYPSVLGKRIPGVLPPGQLTPREMDVLKCIAKGNSTKEAAILLGISSKTAACHRYRLMDKLGIHDTANLVRYAIRQGLVEA